MDGTVIVADDDKNLRAVLTQSLTRAGAKVRATATLSTLWRWLEEGEGDVVLCDVNLADGDALESLPKMRQLRPDLHFVLMSAQNTVITALRADESGAFEYLAKPFDLKDMIEALTRAQNQNLRPQISDEKIQQDRMKLPLIGRSEIMQEIYRRLAKILASDLPVIIEGETGVGKTLVADVIHRYGARKAFPLHRFDGASINKTSIHENFERAGEGSLILEKIDDYLPSEQREIMQAIDRANYPARLITTTTQNLGQMVQSGAFRADLYHHINVLNLELPNLRDRIEDIEELAEYFLFEETSGAKSLAPEAKEALRLRQWPGNVKELQSAILRLNALSSGEIITLQDIKDKLPDENTEKSQSSVETKLSQSVESYARRFFKIHGDQLPPQGFYDEFIGQVDRPLIEVVLEYTGGNQVKTAEILGINRNTLRKKIQNLDISVTKGKKLMQ